MMSAKKKKANEIFLGLLKCVEKGMKKTIETT
jgi:hypothetical protein